MKTKRKNTASPARTLRFKTMPRDYAGLCAILTPRRIRDKTDYANTLEVTDAMAVHAEHFSEDQEDYFDVLCTLLEAYDAEHPTPWPTTPLKVLKYLLEEHDLSGADLSRILDASRQLGPAILRGEREITADHARTLGAYFKVPPGLFI